MDYLFQLATKRWILVRKETQGEKEMSQELLQGIGIAAIFVWWIWVTISTFGVFDMQAQINRLRGRTGEWDSQRRADLAMLEQRIIELEEGKKK